MAVLSLYLCNNTYLGHFSMAATCNTGEVLDDVDNIGLTEYSSPS